MEEEKTLLKEVASGYDAADRPFDFVEEGECDRPGLRTRSGHPGKDQRTVSRSLGI